MNVLGALSGLMGRGHEVEAAGWAGVRFTSLNGKPVSVTRSSGALPSLTGAHAAVALGAVIQQRDDFESAVQRFVFPRSRTRLLDDCGVDFDRQTVLLMGFRMPSSASVDVAEVAERDGEWRVSTRWDRSSHRLAASAAGLMWLVLPKAQGPFVVESFDAKNRRTSSLRAKVSLRPSSISALV